MKIETIDSKINTIINAIGTSTPTKVKRISIGKNPSIQGAIIYIDGLVDKNIINRDILNPLMIQINSSIELNMDTASFLCSNYITADCSFIKGNTEEVCKPIKNGNTLLQIENIEDYVIIDTTGGAIRAVSDPLNETSLRGSRDGFVENLEVNISLLRRMIKDPNLSIEKFVVGRRSQTDLALVYIKDLVNTEALDDLKERINAIDVDSVTGIGAFQEFIDENPYSIFPMCMSTERPDRVSPAIMEGRIAVILNGSPFVLTLPSIFVEFFHTVEDYNERTISANIIRLIRFISVLLVITLPSIYLTLIKYNGELIPIEFVLPVVQSRIGISLSPFIEILILEILMEILREGGLRLPSKIASTLSIVGGIIIGNTAVQSNMVSPTTLLVIGITIIASFAVPSVDMSISIRLLRFPMLFLANSIGILGVATGYTLLILHLSSLENFGVPYMEFNKNDLKDTFIRAPLWEMNSRPSVISERNKKRQTSFRYKFRRKKDE
ncbi:spore germination protein [Clostridium bowmanii]|uniref:spore germination protein n=1 Tax=Clostridium bowmanii TaxID=132925 RepID=UPI001C0E22EC|nr:spore germination protein [Clostridium bowmanii]MBU3191484.1 spore germination protein [Clostridium bowmanii]MCA1075816.1 spore germination protein [Clostridium bowmanii]